MQSQQDRARLKALDGLRGVSALLVAVFHFQALTHIYGLPFVRNSYLFVDFFFVLSGFVLSHAYSGRLSERQDAGRFIIHRFGRLWPLHAAILAAFVGIETLKVVPWLAGVPFGSIPFASDGANPPAAIANHLLLTHAIGIYGQPTWNDLSWSVSVEFWVSVVFVLACLAARSALTLILTLLGGVAALLLVTRSHTGMDVTTSLGLARCFFGFAMGHAVWRLRTLIGQPSTSRATLYELLCVGLIVLFVSLAGRGPMSFAAPAVFALPVLVFSIERGRLSCALQSPAIQAVGRWSYSIYMVQGLVILLGSLGVSLLEGVSGLEIWINVSTDGAETRVISGPPLLLDALLCAYLAIVVAAASFTYRHIELPGIAAFDRLALMFGFAGGARHDRGAQAIAAAGVAPLPKTR